MEAKQLARNDSICVIGAFGYKSMLTGGQPVKSRELVSLLKEQYPEKKIIIIETSNWKKNPLKLLFKMHGAIRKSDNIIMLPAQNGVKIFARILVFYKNPKRKLYYDVIGGWLPKLLLENKNLIKPLIKFDSIWVETDMMRKKMIDLGLENVVTIPNFKSVTPINFEQKSICLEKPFKLCTFSRVMKEKGIEDAIDAVIRTNNELKETAFTLDIYGQIDSRYFDRFKKMEKQFPEYIQYCGVVSPNQSVQTLKDYTALLFLTTYQGEGFAGTLIDALMSGVPTIATDWHYNSEIINEQNGFIINTNSIIDDLKQCLLMIYNKPESILNKSKNCILSAQKYTRNEAAFLIRKEVDN